MAKKQKTSFIGFSAGIEWLELIRFSKNFKYTDNSQVSPIPTAVIDPTGDRLIDPESLADNLGALVKYLDDKNVSKGIHLSIPGSLVRIIEMPNLSKNQLAHALLAETERYTVFSGTEAVLDYEILEETDAGRVKILVIAARKDTLQNFKKAFSLAKVPVVSVETSYISSLRGLAVTGVLDEILEECNGEPWGTIHFSPERVHISIWQNKALKNLREVLIDTSDLRIMGEEAPIIQDLIDDVRRTSGLLKPIVWYTYGIPENISTSLSQRLGRNVRPMLPGKRVDLDNPKISLASIGVAARSFESFPATIDIRVKEIEEESKTGFTGAFYMQVTFAFIIGFLMVSTTIILAFAIMYFQGQVDTLKKDIQTISAQNAVKQAGLDNKKREGELYDFVYDKIYELQGINLNYATIIGELKQKTPENLWFEKIVLDRDNLEIEGKALTYDSIVYFTENFAPHFINEMDNVFPIRNMNLKQIEEDRVDNTILYKFKLQGTLNNDYYIKLCKERSEAQVAPQSGNQVQPPAKSGTMVKH